MSITDNAEIQGLHQALSRARSSLTRQQLTVQASIALVKMIEASIATLERSRSEDARTLEAIATGKKQK